MPKGNNNNLIPANERSYSEATENGKKGGIKSGESRRQKKEEKDRLKKILSLVPNMDIFLDNGAKRKSFDMLGIDKEDITDIEALTDLVLVQSALKGDLNAKKYIDERTGKNPQLNLKESEINLKRKEFELRKKEKTESDDKAVDELAKLFESLSPTHDEKDESE